ncbi:MAG: alcohol dehydrogenase [Rhodobacterales bacterium CG18_big_fil_WC_8_21_14_2_50_71_9]|nr:MAG: alcohol dehydrogenase [Rhodobacterales bacterium CG18_big_fil_WC_8_21_14_2_50_71_9]
MPCVSMHPVASVLLPPGASILDAIRIIDSGTMQIALALDAEGRLEGLVTDGDIRRAILRGIKIEAPVAQILNRAPVIVSVSADVMELKTLMNAERRILRTPAVDAQGRVRGLFLIEDVVAQATSAIPVVLMAGGMGTRLRPHTEMIPKPMVEVAGKAIIERIIERFHNQGFRDFHISLRYLGEKISQYFGDGQKFGVNISYVWERERLGTAGALRLLADRLDRPFIVMNGDLVTTVDFRNLAHYHRDTGAIATMCVREHRIEVPYGVVMQEEGRLLQLREKPTLTQFVNAGIYMLDPEVLAHVPMSGYFDMTSLFESLIMAHPAETATFPIREYWRDIGNPDDLRAVADELRAFEQA